MIEELMERITAPGNASPHAPHAPCLSETDFRRLLEKLPAGAYMCDADGLITYYNQRAVDLWGRTPRLNDPADRFCGSFKLHLADGAPIRHDQCWMALALLTNMEYNGEEVLVERPDGSRLTVLAHVNPIRNESGAVIGALNVLVDISDRKRDEEALREADRAKDQFLAMLAHELRNPLHLLLTSLYILREKGDVPEVRTHAVEVMNRQVGHMKRMLDDLLDVSRITLGKASLDLVPSDLAKITRDTLDDLRPLMEDQGLLLGREIENEPVRILGDPTRLSQALGNLLNNAARFTAVGGAVRVRLNADLPSRRAILSVSDTGIGIEPELLGKIFEPFMQADQCLARQKGGLGLGLSIVKGIVQLHGGQVEAESAGTDRGAQFTITLPLAAE